MRDGASPPRPLLGEGALNPLKELKELKELKGVRRKLKGVRRKLKGVKGHYLQTPATCQLVNSSTAVANYSHSLISSSSLFIIRIRSTTRLHSSFFILHFNNSSFLINCGSKLFAFAHQLVFILHSSFFILIILHS